MFGTESKASYIRVANGQFIMGKGENAITGNIIGGQLKSIGRRTIQSTIDKDANGNPANLVVFDIEIVDGQENYKLSLMRENSSTKDIIRSLVNIPNPRGGTLVIKVYASDNPANPSRPYTNAIVEFNGQKVAWAPLPKAEKVVVGSKTYTDHSAENEKVEEYVETLIKRLTLGDGETPDSGYDGGDMPGDEDDIYADITS